MAVEWDHEYRVRKLFGLTHEQYLDETHESVEWMLRIDGIYQAEIARRQEQANQAGG